MRTVDIDEAKANLSRLIDAAVQGESFIIAEAGRCQGNGTDPKDAPVDDYRFDAKAALTACTNDAHISSVTCE